MVLTVKREQHGTIVYIVPITHSPPKDLTAAVEIPAATKARLRLDHERSWIVTNELNAFTWPGPDIRPIDRTAPARGVSYGYLPEGLIRSMIASVRAHIREGRARSLDRDTRERQP